MCDSFLLTSCLPDIWLYLHFQSELLSCADTIPTLKLLIAAHGHALVDKVMRVRIKAVRTLQFLSEESTQNITVQSCLSPRLLVESCHGA